jgi:hypothetical protein
MSLQWNLQNIENFKELCWVDNDTENRKPDEKYMLNPVTQSIINLCDLVGVSRITNANYKETSKRFAELEFLGIASFETGNPREDDVHEHIGLSTNGFSLDNKKWGNKLRALVREGAEKLINENYSKISV